MKPKGRFSHLKWVVALGLIALIGSCIEQELELDPTSKIDETLISNAQNWYRTSPVTSGNQNFRINNLIAGEPDWKKSIEYIHKGRKVLEIPVNLSVKNLFAQGNKNFKKNSGDYRILLFQLQENQFKPYLFKIENGEDSFDSKNKNLKHLNLNQIPKDFSGKYMFFNLDGGFVGSWIIESGERTRAESYRKPAPAESGKNNARTSDWNYTCEVTTITTYVQAGDGEPEVVAQIELWDCEFTQVPEKIAPPDSGPGTGGEDPGCYEPNPFMEGQVVPCGSLDLDCPCCKAPLSERVLCEQLSPPCDDIPTYSIAIQNTTAWTGKNSGRYSATARKYDDGSPKPHWGLDIATTPGTPVFSVHPGVVDEVVSHITPNKYISRSLGNYVKIKSIDSNGEVFYLSYNHLNYVWVGKGDVIEKGQAVGLSGATGNAGDQYVKKHVHIEATKLNSNSKQIRVNPENYMKFRYDSQGNVSFNPCNN
ncbi:MAG: M23 family metallopeptidase [Algoriphagus sp.]|uniref:M23 family metallopeptidase n=1 Tax=Algoriphagus sp. TaxID=1872435 RepID=UPI0026346C39|nr:M23 family metallopeptidase [Algoriphagus sp.]MDG1277060.1 M23 family metallopeptidase [Algoriphagus sp.]